MYALQLPDRGRVCAAYPYMDGASWRVCAFVCFCVLSASVASETLVSVQGVLRSANGTCPNGYRLLLIVSLSAAHSSIVALWVTLVPSVCYGPSVRSTVAYEL